MDMRQKRLVAFDGLKVLAALFIFWFHSPISSFGLDLGGRMCEFYFVVSGFLMFYNRRGKTELTGAEELRNKVIQLWPLHFFCFSIRFIYSIRGISTYEPFLWKALLNVFCLQAWFSNSEVYLSFNMVSWFLSALLFCYYVSPHWTRIIRDLKKPRWEVALFVGLFVIRFALEHISRNYPTELFVISIHSNPIVRCLEYLMGMVCGKWFMRWKWRYGKIISTIVETILLCGLGVCVFVFNNIWYRAGFVLFWCLFISFFALEGGYLSKGIGLLLGKFSKYEYSFYMIHIVILGFLERMITHAFGEDLVVLRTIVAFVLSCIFAYIYEKQIHRRVVMIMKTLFRQFATI